MERQVPETAIIPGNTLVLFLSDNGPWYGGSTGGLRGMKARPWEGGIRVPMIARWPGRISPGLVSRGICGIIDIFPTLDEAAGVRTPRDLALDGRNILPMLSSANAPSPHEAIYAMSGQCIHIVRSGRWKLHVRTPGATGSLDKAGPDWVDPRGPDGLTLIAPWEQARPTQHPGRQDGDPAKPMMLFDLENDPAEQHDVAAQNPGVVNRLKAMFDKLNAQVPSFTPVEPKWKGLRDIKGGDFNYEPRDTLGRR